MNIPELEHRIRDFINSPRRQTVLLARVADWNKLCSSLDLVGDTQLAIQAYPKLCNSKGDGASYLIVYGILQTLLLQQDAAKHIASALNITIKLPKELNDIRIVRNSAAGHPGLQNENGQSKSCFISRMSLSPIGFDLMTIYSKDRDYKITHVSIPRLLKTQSSYLSEVLSKVVEELERQEMEHREMHKETKLSECFPPTVSYYFEKIFEAICGKNESLFGVSNLDFIQDCLDNFKDNLELRGLWGVYDSINYHYGKLLYPMKELNVYFESKEKSKLNGDDAYIFTSFLVEHLNSLKKIAMEIDEEYASRA